MLYLVCLVLVLIPLFWESYCLKKWRQQVPIRVHVHGTRGKSTITRQICKKLRAENVKVLGKSTGDRPVYILPSGARENICRLAPANIHEQIKSLGKAAKMGAKVVVLEGMALQKETLYYSEKIIQATHIIIANTRPDHAETMGQGRAGVAQSLALILSEQAKIFISPEANINALQKYAESDLAYKNLNWQLIKSSSTFKQVEDMAQAISQDILAKRIDSKLDNLELKAEYLAQYNVFFYDLFSANDVISSRLHCKYLEGLDNPKTLKVALLATRSDRPLRTREFLDWLFFEPKFDILLVIGNHSLFSYFYQFLNKKLKSKKIFCLLNPYLSPEHFLHYLEKIRKTEADLLLVGMGNTKGFAEQFRNKVFSKD